MILSLTVAAFFNSVAYVMGDSHLEGSLCDFQACWLTYFVNLYLNLVQEISTNRYEKLYHLMAWGVPLVMACLPLLKGYYGPAGAWCWITDDHVAWRFGIWYVPLFSLIFLMICCYARIICVANARMQSWLGTFNPERERRKSLREWEWSESLGLVHPFCAALPVQLPAKSPRTGVLSTLLEQNAGREATQSNLQRTLRDTDSGIAEDME
ncbi:hypothetical protein KUCAC02_010132 [Chaenocephalus aceratus]|uniref:Uncharacterized protein n=1 Tax=Chaenocephalus aceratus TaxID=36190 RepID=A0ACB9VYL1_CHAAC|nr:hypothetical protein KUCAC02_010132 [Chaenocephalus aceratus]